MILKSIFVKNFRPFYGEQKLDLSTSEEKSLVLIKAMNDVGKTSLFHALRFCLYGMSISEKPESHVNRTAGKEGDGVTSVTLMFDHQGKSYQLTRTIEFSQGSKKQVIAQRDKLSAIVDGVAVPLKTRAEENEFEEAILPKDASQFFLFDGEMIQKYTKRATSEQVRESIEMVLGIRELLNSKQDLKQVESELSRELDDLLKKKAGKAKEADEIASLGKEVDKIKAEIKNLELKIVVAKTTIDECDVSLADTKLIREKINRLKEIEEDMATTNSAMENLKIEQREFNQQLGVLFIEPILTKIKEIRRKTFSSWRVSAATQLLSEQEENCICGRPINSEVKETLNAITDDQEIVHISSLVDVVGQLSDVTNIENLKNKLHDMTDKEREYASKLMQLKKEAKELNDDIGDQKGLDTQSKVLAETRKRAANDKEEYIELLGSNKAQFIQKEKEHSTRQRSLASTETDTNVREKQDHLDSCRMCKEAVENSITELVDSIRSRVETEASQIFVKLTNAPDWYKGIEITEEYKIKIRTSDGEVRDVWILDPSAGQSQIIALSFLSALNRYTAREAPVMIDTPISRLDPTHKENLINFIPHMSSQVIVLFQPSELRDDDVKVLSPKVSREFEMKRDENRPEITIIHEAKN